MTAFDKNTHTQNMSKFVNSINSATIRVRVYNVDGLRSDSIRIFSCESVDIKTYLLGLRFASQRK